MSAFKGFALGLTLGGAVALAYRSRLNQTWAFVGALMGRPDLYQRIRSGEWAALHRRAFERDLEAAQRRHNRS